MAKSCTESTQNSVCPALTADILQTAKRKVAVPFQLALMDTKDILYCDQLLRLIPGKRLVVQGRWGNKPVVAKLFYERTRAKHHWQRDINGIEALVSMKIPTPPLLYQGAVVNESIHVLIFERIVDAKSLEEIWRAKQQANTLARLMYAVTIELATQHVLGVLQRDLHLKNFLIAKNKIYTLDGGSIQKFDMPLDKKTSLESLALFFAQLGAGSKELQQNLFKYYARARGWIVKQVDIKMLETALQCAIAQRSKRYQKKVFRNSTAFAKKTSAKKRILYDRDYESPEFLKFLKNPDQAFAGPNTTYLKAGKTSSVATIRIDNRLLVVKRYNVKNVWHWLRRCLRATRAITSWRLAHLLRLFDIATAKPVACIENRCLGLRGKSYFIMEHIAGDNIGIYFSHYDANNPQFVEVANEILLLLKKLCELHLTHGDLKMTNILLDQQQKPVLIDLDGMQAHYSAWSLQRVFKKELARFMQNWDNMPTVHKVFVELMK